MPACFDCPFLRSADRLHLGPDGSFEFVYRHFTEDGGFIEYQCEEQNTICFGHAQVLRNMGSFGLDEFSELGEMVSELERNNKDFFRGTWEFVIYHGTPTDALDGR